MKLARVGAAIAAVAIVAAACSGSSSSGKTIKIGISLPLSGSSLASAGPARDGALLAIKEANAAGTVKGYTLTTDILDHSVNGQYDAQQGAKDMTTLVSDSAVMASSARSTRRSPRSRSRSRTRPGCSSARRPTQTRT